MATAVHDPHSRLKPQEQADQDRTTFASLRGSPLGVIAGMTPAVEGVPIRAVDVSVITYL